MEENFICECCMYLIKNATMICKSNELKDFVKTVVLSNNESCKFCFGILRQNTFDDILNQIRERILNFDFKNYKITTCFSPLLNITIAYWKTHFKRQKSNNLENLISDYDIEYLDISLIRRIFKPLFVPFVEKDLKNSDKHADKPYDPKSDFEIKIIFEFTENSYDTIFNTFSFLPAVRKIGSKRFKPDASNDKGCANELIRNCSSDLLYEIFSKNNLLNLIGSLDIKVGIIHENLYLKGSYCKFSREIGQSEWTHNGVKICDSSVENEITKTLKDFFSCDNCVMSSGGREDRDVRMLGSGRPFIIEIVNPKSIYLPLENLKSIQEKVNMNTNLVQINQLAQCDKSEYAVLKGYENSKQKNYTCFVWVAKILDDSDLEKLNQIKDLNIVQNTPIRVMHRRTLMNRNKMIFKMHARKVNENFIILDVLASAGTYIKEFIHSDLGRTNPSLISILGCECDILQLDVMNILYENY